MLELLQRKYYWDRMAKDVEEYVSSCYACNLMKPRRHKLYGQLVSLPAPTSPWRHIAMDFVVGLPPLLLGSRVYDAVLTIVDRFSKMVKYIPVTEDIKAPELANLFIRHVVSQFRCPESIMSDHGSLFTSHYWVKMCHHLSIKRNLSTVYHPQTDGQTEHLNQMLEQYIHLYVNYQQDNWTQLLPTAKFTYNNS